MNSPSHTSPQQQLSQLLQQLQTTETVLDFDNIQLPFQITDTSYQLWRSLFSEENLQKLAQDAPETLDAWAIALMKSLQKQQELLQIWLPLLANLPIPEKLKAKIQENNERLQSQFTEQSQICQAAGELLQQEQQLRQQAAELENLRHRQQELETIQQQVANIDWQQWRQNIETQAEQIEPQKQSLQELQQKQTEIENYLTALKNQRQNLEQDLEIWQNREKKEASRTQQTAAQLQEFINKYRQQLSKPLADMLADVAEQKQELEQVQQQLQQAVADFNEYQQETEQQKNHLQAHYQADEATSRLLPVNSQRVNHLLQQIQENLTELDKELSQGHQIHKESENKQIYRFGS